MRTTPVRLVAAFAVWALASSAAHAQSLLGDRGASCAAVPMGGGTHVITLTGDIPADRAVLMAAGTSGVATFQGAADSAGNSYTATNRPSGTWRLPPSRGSSCMRPSP